MTVPSSSSAESVRNEVCGAVLVMVLLSLVLVTVLIVAFLSAIKTELSSSLGYAEGSSTRLLAETALNIVIGQIQEATQRDGETWVSQPGLIRTFDGRGSAVRAYKLYSSDRMLVRGEYDPVSQKDSEILANWRDTVDLYTDINEPIFGQDGPVFPVIDASALSNVEGFSGPASTTIAPDGTTIDTMPMPLKWLYVLENGELATAESSGDGAGVRLTGADGNAVSSSNRPVARIAFWTDDECCKLNINTAAGGVPWDTPMANTFPGSIPYYSYPPVTSSFPTRPQNWGDRLYEVDFAQFQPSRYEYQRYPGHPATTSLMPVFRNSSGAFGKTRPVDIFEATYSLTPRYSGGPDSSLSGTVRGSQVLKPASDRLYSTLEEFIFSTNYKLDSTDDRQKRQKNMLAPPDATVDAEQMLERLKFFLTTSSRAPELNLHNKPRIVSWPIHETDSASCRTSFDQLIAFCGAIGRSSKGAQFYFTRANPLSTVQDWSIHNQSLYKYLRDITSSEIPGFGGNFSAKFQTDHEQVLTEIFDYIRCLNLSDSTVTTPYTSGSTARGQVLPIIPTSGSVGSGTTGFGRIPTVSEVAIICVGKSVSGTGALAKTTVQFGIYPELFCPMAGFSALAPDIRVNFSPAETKLVVNGTAVDFPADTLNLRTSGFPPGGSQGMSRTGGYMGIGPLLQAQSGGSRKFPMSSTVVVSGLAGGAGGAVSTAKIGKGSSIRFTVEAPDGTKLQEFHYEFTDDVSIPIPAVSSNTLTKRAEFATGSTPENAILSSDSVVSLVPAGGSSDIKGDLRFLSLERVGKGNLGRYFALHKDSGSSKWAHNLRSNYGQAYSLGKTGSSKPGMLVANTGGYDVSTSGKPHYMEGVTAPDIPTGVNGVTNYLGQPGDWDNGPGLHSDGPYVNKADEGYGKLMKDEASDAKIPYIGGYYQLQHNEVIVPTLFSPNRQMPSPVMFGSLPTGFNRGQTWQTLLFRPARAYLPGGSTHPGSVPPADHLLLDNFWMPVVEPYAISEPFSTAGKINLNFQIAPFTDIRRDSGLRGILSGTTIIAMNPNAPTDDASRPFINRYKYGSLEGATDRSGARGVSIRYEIDADATLKRLDQRLQGVLPTGDPDYPKNRKPFISASEICDVPLVPKGVAGRNDDLTVIESKLKTFWENNKLTGDNCLERPYAHLYSRLTTRSNVFTVHVRVQRLVKSRAGPADSFSHAKDRVSGEFRGSFQIERYLDPNLEEYDLSAPKQMGPYKVRVLNTKQL